MRLAYSYSLLLDLFLFTVMMALFNVGRRKCLLVCRFYSHILRCICMTSTVKTNKQINKKAKCTFCIIVLVLHQHWGAQIRRNFSNKSQVDLKQRKEAALQNGDGWNVHVCIRTTIPSCFRLLSEKTWSEAGCGAFWCNREENRTFR